MRCLVAHRNAFHVPPSLTPATFSDASFAVVHNRKERSPNFYLNVSDMLILEWREKNACIIIQFLLTCVYAFD